MKRYLIVYLDHEEQWQIQSVTASTVVDAVRVFQDLVFVQTHPTIEIYSVTRAA